MRACADDSRELEGKAMTGYGEGGDPPRYGERGEPSAPGGNPSSRQWPGFPPPPPGQQFPPTYGPPGAAPPPGQQFPPTYGPPGAAPPPGQQYPPTYGQPGVPPPYGQYPQYGYPPTPGYGYPPPAPVPGGRLAGMGSRFGGLVLDSLILAVPVVIIGALAGAFHSSRTCDAFGTCTRSYNFSTTWTLDLISIAVGLVYAALFVGLQGQTLGHRAVGIRVVDAQTGGLIGPGRAALRWFVLIITGALCTLGYWSPFFDSQRRQGWHDKAADSVVIPR
jgi:uncharacterized RDD family membrane protein YckC